MEGPVHSNLRTSYICCSLIVLFHAVGLAGFLIPGLAPVFLKIVPFHLVLMFILIVICQHEKGANFWLFIVCAYFFGFLIEVLGVNTGIIFGEYTYLDTLGFKLFNTPLIIGINWILIIYSVNALLAMLKLSNRYIRSFAGASLVVFLDVLIEPVAIKFYYWTWEQVAVPFQNYTAWFVISFIMLQMLHQFKFPKNNIAATVMFISQLIFFAALNLWAL